MRCVSGLAVLLLNLLVDLFPMDRNFTWGFDRNPHLPPLNVQHADRNIVTDPDDFSETACEDQHSLAQKVEQVRLEDPGGDGQRGLKGLLALQELRGCGDLGVG